MIQPEESPVEPVEPVDAEKAGEAAEAAEAGEATEAAGEDAEAGEAAEAADEAAEAAEAADENTEAGEPTEAAEAADEDAEPEEPAAPVNPNMKWYAVGAFSNYENRAVILLTENIKTAKLDHLFGELLVPTEEVVELRGGARRTTKRRLMPGYLFIQMEMTSDSWHLVKNTDKIIGFIGDDRSPKPMSPREVAALTQQAEDGVARPKAKLSFEEGTSVRVIDGPFLNFSGTVEEVMAHKQKVRVLVSIFGRSTPVELDFMQIERI